MVDSNVVRGCRVEFCESLQEAAVREFFEETGLQAEVTGLLHVSEVILPKRPYHSITVSFLGRVVRGDTRPEADHPYGEKVPRWLSTAEMLTLKYHPEQAVEKALGISVASHLAHKAARATALKSASDQEL